MNIYAHWQQPKRFHFSGGLEVTFKHLDYSSTYTYNDVHHIGTQGFATYTDIYERTASVNYVNLSGGLFFDWAIVDAPDFKLLFGFFGQFGTTIFEKAKDHQMLVTHQFTKSTPTEYTSTTKIDPISYTTFDAIEMIYGNANLGLKLSPRKYYNKTYVQVDMSIGRTIERIYKDLNGSDCLFPDSEDCFEYEYLFGREKSLFFSIGLTLGYAFK